MFAARVAGVYASVVGLASCAIATRTLAALPGLTPLGAAAMVGDESLCKVYLEYGAESIADGQSILPEDLASAFGHEHLLPMLATFPT